LQVSAVLPGGDPLAEALAAGETPSPEMVAAAGASDTLNPRVAVTLLTCTAAGLIAICLITPKIQALGMVPLENPPETRAVRARDIILKVGYVERPADFAFGFQNETGYLNHFRATLSATPASRLQQWRRILAVSPSPVSFWYRQSPAPLLIESRLLGGPD